MQGTVLKSTGSWYLVLGSDGKHYDCRLKGKMQFKETIRATNPIAVGDWVLMELENEERAIIYEIVDRKNYLIRKATNLSKEIHIVAANVDLLLVVISLKEPKVPLRFLDRVLVSAEAYDINAAIVFNKTDLYNSPELEQDFLEVSQRYEQIGYSCINTCALSGSGIEVLLELMEGKVCAFSGFSGVGKSTLINRIAPDLILKTAEVSKSSQKGKHTTTFAEMFDLGTNTFIIDTPGIKSLGLISIEPKELSHFFPEMLKILQNCKFNTCIHVNEPKCAVKKAVESGVISEERYFSYLNMLEGNSTYR